MTYYLSLGTNIGNLEQNLHTALAHISEIDNCHIKKQSSIYKTKPWGIIDQPDFLNMAIEVKCDLPPEALYKALQDIETQMGRIKTRKWGERLIDIDILFAQGNIIATDTLTIPHKHLHRRDFVLIPMIEIAPNFTHPILKKTIKQIHGELMCKQNTATIILAAGKGTRMKSDKPKVCFELAGKPLIQRVVETSLKVDADLIAVVVGYKKEMVIECLPQHPAIQFVTQETQNGTGHAVMCAKDTFKDYTGNVFILCGDVPLLRAETLKKMRDTHISTNAQCTVLTMILDDPDRYGRIIRDDKGSVCGIVEYRDATDTQRAIKEINTGIYCFDCTELFNALDKVNNQNDQNEYYLTDVLHILYNEGKTIASIVLADINEAAGVNSQEQLAELEAVISE